MKKRRRTFLILPLILFLGAIPNMVWAGEWESYNNESWQSLKSGTYEDKSWQSLKPGTYSNKSWKSLKSGTYENKSWKSLKSGTYEDKSWRPKKILCPKHYIKLVKPQAALVGDSITIRGNRFGEEPGEVIFNEDIYAEIISWRNNRIKVEVPEDAVTGKVKVIKACPSVSVEDSHSIIIEKSTSE